MALRDRTKKRLRWFVITVVTLGVAGTGTYFVRERQLERAAAAGRAEGVRLLESGDYFNAMHKIGPYVRRHPKDVAALFDYARARQQVPEPNRKHVLEAISLYRTILGMDAAHVPAAEALLALYQQNGLVTEALQLSEELLRSDAGNGQALAARAASLFALGRFAKDEALNAAAAYSNAYPQRIDGHLLTLEIIKRGGGDDARQRVLAHCAALRKKHPGDARFTLLSGIAHATSGDVTAAKPLIREASAAEMDDPITVQLLVEYCDRLEMFDRSSEVLRRHGKRGGAYRALLIRRLWEEENYQAIAQQPQDEDGRVDADAQAAAFRSLALYRLGRREESALGAKALQDASSANASARAWAGVVAAVTRGDRLDDGAVIAAAQQALRETKDPYIQLLLGDAYARTGDPDMAVELWQQARAAAPGWAAPLAQLGHAALAVGRFDEAGRLAEAALARSPDSANSMLLLARARAMRSASLDAATATNILALLDRVEKLAPDDQSVPPLRVHVLASAGKLDAAVDAARRALASSPPKSAATLIQLATVSHALRLGIENECLQRCEQLHGMSPDLAFNKAKREFDAGRKAEALQIYSSARPATATGEQAGNWEVGWARLLEMAGDPRAKASWIAVADAMPDDSMVQWLSISAKSVQGDRDFIGRVLDRLKSRLGDQGLTWRLSRVRWLLGGTESQDAVEAAFILNDLTRSMPNMLAPRLLLADCLVKLGNISGAIEQLTVASNLQPQSSSIALQLARLLQSRGETARARGYLDRVLGNRASDLAQAREAATMVEAAGDPAAALAGLERAYGDALKEPPADLLLAKLYRRANQHDRVDAICRRLLDSSDLNTLAFAADFYAAEGRTAEAGAVLEKVQASKADPAAIQIILGSHALRANGRAKATEHFAAAVRIAPKNPSAWRQLVRMQIIDVEEPAALKTLGEATAALPEDRGLAAAARHAPAVLKLKQRWPELVGMWSDVLDTPGEEPTLGAVLDLLGRTTDAAPLTAAAAGKIWALAGSRPQFYPLQVLATRACIDAGRKDDACVVARRAAELREESFGMAVQTLAAAGRWGEVANLFRPKLTQSSQWRIDWMRFATSVHPDPQASAAWLREVEPLAIRGAVLERLALAESWQVLGKRAGNASFTARSTELTSAVAGELKAQPHSAAVALSLGCLQEAHGDTKLAEASYRKALEMDPSLTIAQNNLAMLLAKQGGNLEEALQLATRAAGSADANVVSFYDTLAFVRVQRKEYGAAQEALAAALKLKPDHLWCQIRMTDVLALSGQVEKARASLEQLERELPKRGPVSSEVTGRLQDVRLRLTRPAS